MMNLSEARKRVDRQLADISNLRSPETLYEPMDYLLSLGGKRMRPYLCLLGASVAGGDPQEAVDAAVAIELFHNFSLMHDDIMDEAPLRRGKPTVHARWNENQAILSGDAMLVCAYDLLIKSGHTQTVEMLALFNQTALEVCEGQQLDMDFENREDVTVEEYIEMIRLKTSVLIGASLSLGAKCSGASGEVSDALYDFGINLGLAFQLRDDYLDTFGDSEQTGKQSGGDILADKKTYLHLCAVSRASDQQRAIMLNMPGSVLRGQEKVQAVRTIMEQTGAKEDCQRLTEQYLDRSMELLSGLKVRGEAWEELSGLARFVTSRSY
ncbi:MAG: polyprenyl synthetase family protein [Flavobacteriales bacterium]|nr:polyprenyl synthetase family protein [Flavobacteriales bacterium]